MQTVSTDDEATSVLSKSILSKTMRITAIEDIIDMLEAFCVLRSYEIRYNNVIKSEAELAHTTESKLAEYCADRGGLYFEKPASIQWGLRITKQRYSWECDLIVVQVEVVSQPTVIYHINIEDNGVMNVTGMQRIFSLASGFQ
jgi:hypothetical protein